MSSEIQVRRFAETDEIAPITTVLHAAYSSLATAGFRYLASHQDDATTLNRLRSGFAFLVECDGKLLGTATLYRPSPDSQCEWYRQDTVWRFGQFGVRPGYQRQGIGARLYDRIEAQARAFGAAKLALDTAEGALHLRRWYEKLGFRFVQFVSWPDTNYRSVVLSKDLTELA